MNELNVTVSTQSILEKLERNKQRFVKSYKALLKAYEKRAKVYQKKYTEYLQKATTGQKTKKDVEPSPPQEPDDRTKSYDFYLQMLSHHTSPTIQLSEEMYRKLWDDKWSWMSRHIDALAWYSADSEEVATVAALYAT